MTTIRKITTTMRKTETCWNIYWYLKFQLTNKIAFTFHGQSKGHAMLSEHQE